MLSLAVRWGCFDAWKQLAVADSSICVGHDGILAMKWMLPGVSLFGGLALLVLSAIIDQDWWSALTLNLGTSLILVVPIFVVSFHLENAVESVRQESRAAIGEVRQEVAQDQQRTRASLDQIQQQFDEIKSRRINDENDQLAALSTHPDQPILYNLLDHYVQTNVVSKAGFRACIGDPDLWATVSPSNGSLKFQIFKKYEEVSLFKIWWRADESVLEFYQSLMEPLERAGYYYPNGLTPKTYFEATAKALEVVAATRRARAGEDLGPARQLCPPQWILYDSGIGTAAGFPSYFVAYQTLHQRDWRRQVGGKSWADPDSFDEAMTVAEHLGYGRRYLFDPAAELQEPGRLS